MRNERLPTLQPPLRSVPARRPMLGREQAFGARADIVQVQVATATPGRPLDLATRADMEPRFGYDFANVRIHTDDRAAQSAQSIGALSYTVGSHIAFAPGQYAPETPIGRLVLAHELVHVAQQSHTSPDSDLTIAPTGLGEREADDVSATVASGGVLDRPVSPAPVSVQRLSTGAKVGLGIGGGLLGLAGLAASIVGIDTALRESRGLDETERSEASRVFGNSLDYDKVRVAEDPIMSIGGYARTPGNTIYFPKGTTKDKDSPERRGWYYPFLIHEMTHTWQTQHGVSTMRKVLTALRGHSAYNYGGPEGLTKAASEGAHFVDFNTEQQASICGDYASALINGGDTAPFEPFIAEVKNGGLPVEHNPATAGGVMPAGKTMLA